MAGHLPDVGERFTFNGWLFTVHAKEGARIDRVRVTRLKGNAPVMPSKEIAGKDASKEQPAGKEPTVGREAKP
jgi:hypothetical protein